MSGWLFFVEPDLGNLMTLCRPGVISVGLAVFTLFSFGVSPALGAAPSAPSALIGEEGPEAITFSGDTGPAYWGEVKEDWAVCSEDMRQSPIDLRKFRKDSSLEDLELDIRPSATHIMNTGYQLRLAYEEGSTLTLDGSVYMLV